MTKQSETHRVMWIENGMFDNLNKLRIRDESNNSIVKFLYEFYMEHMEDKE